MRKKLKQGGTFRYFDSFDYTNYRLGNVTQEGLKPKYRYLESIQTFEIELIIADTKWIYATYPDFGFVVKQKVRKNAALRQQKGRIHRLGFTF
jgi:hypothetical protein